eukprot:CAMPEP_0171003062 /NCGR_PEP_ID=MMETSP0736-20130129/16619_1 /TAXON_ID=186038 /ORGANISM="Fragilariopsis kerguelensis, Strain L26-C5" /LENGTH=363 /DNA_ID=CAMNT_0011431647 /DNA_START=43 /DNA_END=1134 /DNA_ORIENTATION=-
MAFQRGINGRSSCYGSSNTYAIDNKQQNNNNNPHDRLSSPFGSDVPAAMNSHSSSFSLQSSIESGKRRKGSVGSTTFGILQQIFENVYKCDSAAAVDNVYDCGSVASQALFQGVEVIYNTTATTVTTATSPCSRNGTTDPSDNSKPNVVYQCFCDDNDFLENAEADVLLDNRDALSSKKSGDDVDGHDDIRNSADQQEQQDQVAQQQQQGGEQEEDEEESPSISTEAVQHPTHNDGCCRGLSTFVRPSRLKTHTKDFYTKMNSPTQRSKLDFYTKINSPRQRSITRIYDLKTPSVPDPTVSSTASTASSVAYQSLASSSSSSSSSCGSQETEIHDEGFIGIKVTSISPTLSSTTVTKQPFYFA